MVKKKHTAEEIVTKLREADVVLSKGQTIQEACRQLAISGWVTNKNLPPQSE